MFFILLAFIREAQATTFVVSNLKDSGQGTLRQAILDANADASVTPASPHIIDATGVTGTVNLLSTLPNIAVLMTINGPAAGLTITPAPNNRFRIFIIDANQTVTFNHLIITKAYSDGTPPITSTSGSGIYNNGTLTLNYCAISDCSMMLACGSGAALYNSNTGSSTINYCLFSNKVSYSGGAVAFSGNKTHTILNSTFTGDKASVGGGAIALYDGVNVTIKNSTISGNTEQSTGVDGAAIYNVSSSLNLYICTVVRNIGGSAIENTGNSSTQISNSIVTSIINLAGRTDLRGTGFTSLYGHNIFGTNVIIEGNTNNMHNIPKV